MPIEVYQAHVDLKASCFCAAFNTLHSGASFPPLCCVASNFPSHAHCLVLKCVFVLSWQIMLIAAVVSNALIYLGQFLTHLVSANILHSFTLPPGPEFENNLTCWFIEAMGPAGSWILHLCIPLSPDMWGQGYFSFHKTHVFIRGPIFLEILVPKMSSFCNF